MRIYVRLCWSVCCVSIALLCLSAPAHAQRALPPAGEKSPNDLPEEPGPKLVSRATAVLRIVCPADSGLSSPALIESLAQTGTGITDARDEFNTEFGKDAFQKAAYGPFYEINLETTRFEDLPAGIFMADITVNSWDKRLPADKLLNQVQGGLRRDLALLENDPRQLDARLLRVEKDSQAMQERVVREAKEIENLERALGLRGSIHVWEQRFLRVDAERTTIQLRATGLQALRESLQKRIAELAPKVASAAQNDPVVVELKKVVEIREAARAKAAKVVPGIASDADEGVAQARAEFAKQVRLATQDAGGLRLTELQQRLEDTESELAEETERLKHIAEEFSRLDEILANNHPITAELENKKAILAVLQKAADKLTGEVLEIRMQRSSHVGPSVTLISAEKAELEK